MPESKINALAQWFDACPEVVVAFSGGVDSALVTFLARRFLGREKTTAVISASPSLKLSDLDEAKSFCRDYDIPIKIIHTRELENPDYFSNPVNRCYFCKHTLYTDLSGLVQAQPQAWVINGTNANDLGDYRPGLQAAAEFSVRSPLAECGLDKKSVREIAAYFDLRCWNKPASPCMSSRIPYGERVTLEKLNQIEAGEAFIQSLGFPVVRLRHLGKQAVVEVPGDQIHDLRQHQQALQKHLMQLGFCEVVIDPEGFVSGKLNRVIP